MKSKAIKNWSPDDRPREKMTLKGAQSLSNAELLAILLGTGNRRDTAVDLARNILEKVNNNLMDLGKLDIYALKQVNGIGTAKAVIVMAALELGRRRRQEKASFGALINNPEALRDLLLPYFENSDHEYFYAVYLNARNNVLDIVRLGEGSAVATVVDVRRLMRVAVDIKAVNVIVAHNHPSGSLQPSEQDNKLTRRIRDGLELFGCKLLDHLIVTDSGFYSYAEDDKMLNI
jgi:DNA repair protein RadC